MIAVLLLCTIQSVCSVAGSMQLHSAYTVHDCNTPGDYLSATASQTGLIGLFLTTVAFLVLAYTLSIAKASTVIPVNTAITFLATILLGLVAGHERISIGIIAGMVLIASGIAIVIQSR